MTYLIYDLVLVLALLFFLWRGYRKGFVLTLCGFLAIFVAFIGASAVSSILAEPVAAAIEPMVASRIQDTVSSYYQRSPAETAGENDWLAQLPLDEVLEPLKDSKVFQGFADAFQKAVDDGLTDAAAHAVQALAHFVAVQIARNVIFIAAFIAILTAWFFFSRALDLVAKLPVLNTVNRWAGGAIGLCKGALIVFIAVWLFKDSYIPPEAVESTYLLKFLCNFTPLSFFL